MTATEMVRRLDLKPHPEGGHFRETRLINERAASTAILFLLARGERSHWHRIDAVEIWHFHAGAPLVLSIADDRHIRTVRLGADFGNGEQPQAVVPAHVWQAAESMGDWTLMGCTVAPGFEFSGFELAPKDWHPRPDRK